MFEVTISEILPDGSRVPVIRDGKEIPVQELDGLALLGVEKDSDTEFDACTTTLNISASNIAGIIKDGNRTLRTGAMLASISIINDCQDAALRSCREESATDATE